jgi:hypothetical protein
MAVPTRKNNTIYIVEADAKLYYTNGTTFINRWKKGGASTIYVWCIDKDYEPGIGLFQVLDRNHFGKAAIAWTDLTFIYYTKKTYKREVFKNLLG